MIRKNRDIEFDIGMSFFGHFNNITTDSILHDDNPDFLVLNDPIIGVELTHIFNKTNRGVVRKRVEGSRDSLMGKLKQVWDYENLPGCHIVLMFRDPVPIKKKELFVLAQQIVDLEQHRGILRFQKAPR